MNRCRRSYIALLLILSAALRLSAQSPWHYLGVDGLGVRISSLAFNSSNRLFAGTERNGVYQFDGARWYGLNTNLPTTMSNVNVVVSPKNVLVAWTPSQRSWRYYASQWTPMTAGLPDSVDMYTLTSAPDGTFWAVLNGGTIWYYDTSSDVWHQQKPVLTQSAIIYGIAFSPSRMCAATADGVYWIGATSWQPMNTGLGNIPITTIASDPVGRFYAGSNNVLYAYETTLDQWQPILPALPITSKIRSIMFDPGGLPLLLTNQGLRQYNGAKWIAVDTVGLEGRGDINSAATDLTGRIALGVANRGVFIHDSVGWRQSNAGLGTNMLFTALALDHTGGIYVGTSASPEFDGGVYRYDGTVWEHLSGGMPDSENVRDIAVGGPDNQPVALTVDSTNTVWNVYHHTQTGWVGLDSAHRSGLDFRTLAISPTGALLAGTTTGVHRHADTGWVAMNIGLGQSVFSVEFDGGGNVYARSADRLYRYDGGMWRQYGPPLPDYIWSFTAGPNGELGVSTHSQVYRYNGTTWMPITLGLPFGSSTEALAFSRRGELFAGTTVGIFRYQESGTWVPMNLGLPNNKASVYFMDFDAADKLLVTATEFGIWSSTDVSDVQGKFSQTSANPALSVTPIPLALQSRVRYRLPQSTDVHLSLWNLRGQQVAVLASGVQEAGPHTVTLDARALSVGVYCLRLRAGDRVTTLLVAGGW